jgi:hypothetical protein
MIIHITKMAVAFSEGKKEMLNSLLCDSLNEDYYIRMKEEEFAFIGDSFARKRAYKKKEGRMDMGHSIEADKVTCPDCIKELKKRGL